MATQTWDFTTDAGLTYDPLLIQVAGGLAEQVGGMPADLMLYMTWNTTIVPDHDVGDAVGTNFNGAAITAVGPKVGAGCLDIRGNAYTRYLGTQVGACGGTGTYACWIKPDYNGFPGVNQSFWTPQRAVGNQANRIVFRQNAATGQLRTYWNDSLAVYHGSENWGVWNPTAGTWYHMELDLNLPGADTQLYVDGVAFGGPALDNWVRDTNLGLLTIGAEASGGDEFDGWEDDYRVWDTVQHVANFVPPTTEIAGTYGTTSPTIVFNAFQPIAFNSFAATVTAPAGTSIRFALRARGWQFWFNGHFWDWRPQGTATVNESCTFAEMVANFRYLKPYDATQLVAYFTSDGSGTAQLDNVVIDYDQGLG